MIGALAEEDLSFVVQTGDLTASGSKSSRNRCCGQAAEAFGVTRHLRSGRQG